MTDNIHSNTIVSLARHTTRNARKIKYFTAILGNGESIQIVMSPQGQWFWAGAIATPEQLKEIKRFTGNGQ